MIKGKKGTGIASYVLERWDSIIFLTFVFLTIVLLVNVYGKVNIDTNQAQAEVLYNMIIYSPNFFWVNDAFEKPLPGMINLTKFNENTISEVLNYDYERYAAVEFLLRNDIRVPVNKIYYNQLWYDRWKVKAGIEGASGVSLYKKRLPVTYIENDMQKRGTLEINIIIPNS